MAEWVTAAEILTGAGVGASPSPDDEEWAEASAAAVNAGYDHAMAGAVYTSPPLPAELRWSARVAGVETFKRREATFGLTGYVDLQGAAIRIARDYLEAQRPIIARYATFGLG